MRKKYIRKRFELSLETYEEHAVAQAKIASILFSLYRQTLPSSPGKILELGCGTGFLTRQLRQSYPEAQLFLNDLNEKAASTLAFESNSPCQFLPGDAETIELPSALDLIISASTFQWFNDLPSFFERIRPLISTGGTLAFSSFDPDNFRELRALSGKGLNYLSAESIETALIHAGFSIVHKSVDTIALSFPSPLDVLRHLKFTGVNAGFATHWTKGTLASFSTEYARLFPSPDITGGVTLTYSPLYFIAQAL